MLRDKLKKYFARISGPLSRLHAAEEEQCFAKFHPNTWTGTDFPEVILK